MTIKESREADALIERILSRYFAGKPVEKKSMARTRLVVDENVNYLAQPLKEANLQVTTPPAGMDDETIKQMLLSGRILVTKNTKDFVTDAPILEYGIIGLEALPFIDSSKTYKDNKTAQMISRAISRYNLKAKHSGFILMLHPNGRHVLRDID